MKLFYLLFFFLVSISLTAQDSKVVIFRKAKFSGGLSAIAVENADSLLFLVKSNKAIIFRLPAGAYKFTTYLDMSDKRSKPVEWALNIAPHETKYFEFDAKAAWPTGLPVQSEMTEVEFQNFLIDNPKWKQKIENAESIDF